MAADKGYRNGTPLGEFSTAPAYFWTLLHAKTRKPAIVFLKTVLVDFFALQWSVKFGFKKIAVVSVDHSLDSKVPFRPETARVYLDFANFWIRAISVLYKYFDIERASDYCADFLHRITRAYQQAARVYAYKMTTTKRPPTKNKIVKFIIRAFDPHYLCVPSLHISIVALTYSFYKNVFKQNDFPRDKIDSFNRALYNGAVEIAESVLYMKQHSVNCIPAALYMMLNIAPDLFSIDDAVGFIDALFADVDDVSCTDRREIAAHIQYMFERLVLEGINEDDWAIPVMRWIDGER